MSGKDDRLQQLADAPIGRLLIRYSIPAVVGIMVMQLYNIVDRIFIGQVVGSNAIAGLAITFPVSNVSAALGVLIGAGASARVSIFLGSNDYQAARKVTGNALTLTLTIGVAYIAMFGIFLDPILELFGATEETIPYARDMMLYMLPGLLLTNISFSFNNVMRASGFPRKAMITMFIGAIANIILDPIFIYWLDWGIKGAAIATDIAMALSAWFVMAHFVKPHGEVYFSRGNYRLVPSIVVGIVSIGAAPCIVNAASCLINILLNRTLNAYGGADAIAAAGVMVTYTAFLCCIVLGFCQGMQPIVGYNYGARRFDRLKRAFWITAAISTVVCGAGWIVGECWPRYIAAAFIREPDLVDRTADYLQISMTLFWVVGFQIVTTTFFQSIGKVGKSIFMSLTRQVLFLIPLLIILPRLWGLNGIWASFPGGDLLATIVTLILIIPQLRRLK